MFHVEHFSDGAKMDRLGPPATAGGSDLLGNRPTAWTEATVPFLHTKLRRVEPAIAACRSSALAKLFHVEHSSYPPYPRRCLNLGHCRPSALPLASNIEERAWPE